MRIHPIALRLLAVWVAFAPILSSSQPQLQPASLLRANGAVLDVGDYAIPCVCDWNGDGRKDLIVGYRYADKVAIFYNTGSDAAPQFGVSSNLQAGGIGIQHPSAGCGAPAPFVCDFDNDGKRDLLVGTGAEGYVYFYRNTNTDAAPVLAPGVQLKLGSAPLAVATRATPYVYDWDGDGLPDLLCGDGNGAVNFFRNIGSLQAPVFAAAKPVQAAGVPLNLGIRSIVRMCDWDDDGLPDLIGSSATGVYWCRNIGSSSVRLLSAAVPLQAPIPSGGQAPITTGARMRLEMTDWNNDGIPDILLGNVDGTISFFEAYRFQITAASSPGAATQVLQWNSAPFLRYHLLTNSNASCLTNIDVSNIPSSGRSTMWTNSTAGSVSFYRVQIAP